MIASEDFTLIIPVWNEEKSIPHLFHNIMKCSFLSRAKVIIVDDGSTDETARLAFDFAVNNSNYEIICLEHSGKDRAIWAGILSAKTEWIGIMDGDGQYAPEDFKVMIEYALLNNADSVWGIRINRRDNWYRLFISRIGRMIKTLLIGKQIVSDTGCGIFICRLKFMERIISLIPEPKGQLHCHLPDIISRIGGVVSEITVRHYSRQAGKAKFAALNRILPGFRSLLQAREFLH